MKDELIRVICINNKGDNRLIIYKQYKALKFPSHGLYRLYNDNDYTFGLFPCYLFKEIKQVRQDRLKDILR